VRPSKQDRVRGSWRWFGIVAAAALALSAYLFVTAPPPLAAPGSTGRTLPIRAVFSILELENEAARAMWTEEIVNHGKAVGLAFQENWRDERVQAGPLPALFLRETAKNLERSSLRLRLFLGSRFPINAANRFTGEQAERFATLEQAGAPQFFVEPTTQQQTAMFADRAVVQACVTCHNTHPGSPKTDWQVHAIMGAATWMYPDDAVTTERALEMVAALRTSIRAAYATYLKRVAAFSERPEVGSRWPKDGFFLPSEDVFMRELARRSSPSTVQGLLDPGSAEAMAGTERPPEPPPIRKPAVAEPTEPGNVTLVIRTAKITRVVVDHAGTRMMASWLPAGGTTSLSSPPPLRVKLSNPDGVQLEYDGKPVELPGPPEPPEDLELTLGQPREKS
jgi:adenylate cyclase